MACMVDDSGHVGQSAPLSVDCAVQIVDQNLAWRVVPFSHVSGVLKLLFDASMRPVIGIIVGMRFYVVDEYPVHAVSVVTGQLFHQRELPLAWRSSYRAELNDYRLAPQLGEGDLATIQQRKGEIRRPISRVEDRPEILKSSIAGLKNIVVVLFAVILAQFIPL